MVYLTKINNDIVKPIKLEVKDINKPILGSQLFSEIYANICIISKKKTGKTTIVYNVIKKCANSNTKIIVFSSTFYKDKSFDSIRDFCNKHNIYLESHTSLKDDNGEDILEKMIKELENEVKEDDEKEEKTKDKKVINLFDDSDSEEEEVKPKKYKYRSPEYLFVFDDLSNELKAKSINMFLKKNRHFKSKVIIATQYIHDLKPEALKQMDYFLLLRGHSDDKLEQFYKHADLSIDFDIFKKLYKNATDSYNFLYIDNNNQLFRKNFDKLYSFDQ